MNTVMYPPTSLSTMKKRSLPSLTCNVVHPDRTNSLVACRSLRRRWGAGEAKLAAHHVRVIDIPAIITHCAPDSVYADFHTAIASITIDQAYGRTLYTGVLTVGTIMFTPPTVSAVVQLRLVSWARQTVQPYRPWSLAVSSAAKCSRGLKETKLFTHYVGFFDVPAMIAYCAPLVIVKDFDPSRWWCTAVKTEWIICNC